MTRLAIYAGTFDPMTLGHVDLIQRSAELFENVIIAVGIHADKDTLFTLAERVNMAVLVKDHLGLDNVEVESFGGLLVSFARERSAQVLIRGLRAYSDFEYEFQMALTNRKMAPEIETLFMMPKEIHSYVSSSTVREVARLGGDASLFVPDEVLAAISAKLSPAGDRKSGG